MQRILLLALIALVSTASAHHGSTSQFDQSRTLEVSGVVTKIRFVNPHSYVYFDVTTEDGEVQNWRCEMRAATALKRSGWSADMFPEGTRQSGTEVIGVFDGTAYLAQKTGAPIIPIGVGGTEAAMASGSKGIKRVRCSIVVGEPITPPEGRLSQPQRRAFSEDVSARLQVVFDEAIALANG